MSAEQQSTPEPKDQAPGGAEIRRWVEAAMVGAEAKTGVDTEAYMVGDVLGITEWFVLTSGQTEPQVSAIVRNVEYQVSQVGGPKPIAIEGKPASGWVLLDYGSFVVHVFDTERREFYELERLWGDVPRIVSPTVPAAS